MHKSLAGIAIALASIMLSTAQLCAQPLDAIQRAAIDKIAQDALDTQRVPGISLAVARGSDILYAQGYGYRDVAHRFAAVADTIYAIGSNTKQFTAAAVMLLAQDKKLDIDAKVADYLPSAPHAAEITVRELLDQTSGLPNYVDHIAMTNRMSTEYRPEQLVALVKNAPLDFLPGTKWEYSNTNYVLLGMLIEKASGMSYSAFVQRRIIAPLGLTSTSFPKTVPVGPQYAVGYQLTGDGATPVVADLSWAYAAGALFSNVADLVKWDDAFWNGRVVDPASLTLMTTPAKLPDGTDTKYGFGWFVSTMYGQREVWHNGGLPGFSTRNATFPDDDHLEIVVLANTISFDPASTVRRIFEVVEPQIVANATPTPAPTSAPGEDPAITARAKEWFVRLEKNDIDRSQLTADMSNALTTDKAAQLAAALGPMGAPTAFVYIGKTVKDPYTIYQYLVQGGQGALVFTFVLDPAGKVAGMFVKPQS
ncbi:MAG TPA: serine hydrolase domain-containing protein [Candidatus Eremiobacteraceae bacterium]|nr:serine hydrolase domain-containing protein [Candidatus Eremiobacteraceae bacterium]